MNQSLKKTLNKLIRFCNNNNYPVVLDIDATVLNNQKNVKCRAQPVSVGKYIVSQCHKYNIPIYFVTARPYSERNANYTKEQLSCLNYAPYEKLYMRPDHIKGGAAVSKYKRMSRKDIVKRCGCKIGLNVGDQCFDLQEYSSLNDIRHIKKNGIQLLGPDINADRDLTFYALKL